MQLCCGALARWSALLISAVKLVESQRKPIAMRSRPFYQAAKPVTRTVLSSWIGADSPRRLLDRATSSCSFRVRKFGQRASRPRPKRQSKIEAVLVTLAPAQPSRRFWRLLSYRGPDARWTARPSVEITEQETGPQRRRLAKVHADSPQPTPKGIRRLRGLGVDGQE